MRIKVSRLSCHWWFCWRGKKNRYDKS